MYEMIDDLKFLLNFFLNFFLKNMFYLNYFLKFDTIFLYIKTLKSTLELTKWIKINITVYITIELKTS